MNKYKVTYVTKGSEEVMADRLTPGTYGVGFFVEKGRKEELVAYIPVGQQLLAVKKVGEKVDA